MFNLVQGRLYAVFQPIFIENALNFIGTAGVINLTISFLSFLLRQIIHLGNFGFSFFLGVFFFRFIDNLPNCSTVAGRLDLTDILSFRRLVQAVQLADALLCLLSFRLQIIFGRLFTFFLLFGFFLLVFLLSLVHSVINVVFTCAGTDFLVQLFFLFRR